IYIAAGKKEPEGDIERILQVIDTKQLGKKPRVSHTVKSRELFTGSAKKFNPKRMLLVGNTGMGKTYISKELQRTWAEGKTNRYECIIYLTFQELNLIEYNISINELLETSCESLSSVLTLRNVNLLIILDGLDEFKCKLNLDDQSLRSDVDTPLPISDLVSKLITKELLPNVDIMVTASWNVINNLEKYFTCMCVIQEFDDKQIKQYFDYICEDKYKSKSICDLIKKDNVSHFASVPLYSFMLHQIMKNVVITSESSVKNLNTSSKFLIQFLKSCSESILKDRKSVHESPAKDMNPEDIVRQLGKLSYKILLSGQLIVYAEVLKIYCLNEKILTECFPSFFYKKRSSDNSFEYRHPAINEMFAAFYCACIIRDNELKECLDAWVRGIIPQNVKSKLLFDVPIHHRLQLENFTRLFMGFLSTGNDKSLQSDSATLKDTTREKLIEWFQGLQWKDLHPNECLNLLHCIFELQDPVVTQKVSAYMKNIRLFNKPLSAIDVQALRFSLKGSKLEELDLRFCELGDKDIYIYIYIYIKSNKQAVITDLKLWSNKLSEKSGEILSEILHTPQCVIEVLSVSPARIVVRGAAALDARAPQRPPHDLCLTVGNNHLGPAGVRCLWKALESNQTLKTLHVHDNDINDESIETLVQSLTQNTTLKELFLCMNDFSKDGLKKFKELRSDLKVVQKI
uniref:NACHT domain-containing protein n=1 Tax=Latimeria chalumnae TaxID=7897 RepID=H3ADB2_LATCH